MSGDTPKKRASWARRLLGVLAALVALVLVILAFPVLQDQTRPIAPPMSLWGDPVLFPRTSPSASPDVAEPIAARRERFAGRATARADAEIEKPNETLVAALRPIPDVTGLRADLIPVAEAWNRDAETLVLGLFAFRERARAMPADGLEREWSHIVIPYNIKFVHHVQALPPKDPARANAIYRFHKRLLAEIAMERGHWDLAAMMMQNVGDEGAMIYCLRQRGWRGRAEIAEMTVERCVSAWLYPVYEATRGVTQPAVEAEIREARERREQRRRNSWPGVTLTESGDR